ncbi:amidohydrolase family protein [Frigoribacterium faeni]|uniref:Cytosine/adenosine deaminase-related metal-dependent hydrolase n=1 Tax=Frigoribacterium faeni TaxID=145483 RepID=A0A7W3JIU4_9MICO|nr:amidohydrolase family protein [Frigoribacterium faeni]MBA8813666.1 cytosine/adenosine deaminase-related metal-dependent hydrolase [Frigoribacterium faeni]BFF14952.1 amidohydrolase family protein [Microbacterium flavescens]GEK83311.1 hydroxyatrazine ethylaminohydrolase [Frigoribacterium faeni]
MLEITGATRIVVDETTETTGSLFVDGGVIVDGSSGVVTETVDASGCVVTPGLVNAHHHLLQSGFRTLPGTRGVPMKDWLPTMAAAYGAARIDPSLVSATTAVGVAEGLLSGVTTVADHQLNWPSPETATTDDTVAVARSIADAARALGGRLVFVRGSARDDPQSAAASAEAIVRDLLTRASGDIPTGGVTDDGMLQIAVGPAGVHSDSRETFQLLGEVAARHGLRRRTQANEQVDVVIALERYGRRPLDLLDEWGWLAPDVTVAHLCAVDASEIARLVAAGVTATHAPGCDLPMGWGIAPVAALQAAGVVVGLGTSGGGSNDAGHLLADARLAMQVAPLVGPALSARTVLGMATAGSAAGLGRSELGHLRPGAAADLCLWDVSGVADAGVADPVAGLLWASPGRRPRDVYVAGRPVVREGRLLAADERDLVAALAARLAR